MINMVKKDLKDKYHRQMPVGQHSSIQGRDRLDSTPEIPTIFLLNFLVAQVHLVEWEVVAA